MKISTPLGSSNVESHIAAKVVMFMMDEQALLWLKNYSMDENDRKMDYDTQIKRYVDRE